ncbi:MAG: KamA family radical SAM protein [Verrucomicrobium sp.]|nr:KamA family radical SAM protein [Verrucomicrobium sp.]
MNTTAPRDPRRDFSPAPRQGWEHVSDADWNDWSWQLRNRLTTLRQIEERLPLTESEREGIVQASVRKLAVAVTPHFFSLIDREDPNCPIRRQVIPRKEELDYHAHEMSDPCGENHDMVAPGLVHRYPDRVLFLVTDRCAAYCRYCTRSRLVSGVGEQELEVDFEEALAYLRAHTEVRDVLLSGGDPLLLSDGKLRGLLSKLREIPHIEIVRIGSRVPIFLPQRITPELCAMLREFHPLWINVHTNHPRELTTEVRDALGRLSDAGVPMGNQAVLLKDVNDDADVLRILSQKLIRCRVRPYYLYQCDLIQGSQHLRVPVSKGLELMEQLRGHTTGFSVPQYVVDGPGGGGKIPLNPQYIIARTGESVLLRNFKGEIYEYTEGNPSASRTITPPIRHDLVAADAS